MSDGSGSDSQITQQQVQQPKSGGLTQFVGRVFGGAAEKGLSKILPGTGGIAGFNPIAEAKRALIEKTHGIGQNKARGIEVPQGGLEEVPQGNQLKGLMYRDENGYFHDAATNKPIEHVFKNAQGQMMDSNGQPLRLIKIAPDGSMVDANTGEMIQGKITGSDSASQKTNDNKQTVGPTTYEANLSGKVKSVDTHMDVPNPYTVSSPKPSAEAQDNNPWNVMVKGDPIPYTHATTGADHNGDPGKVILSTNQGIVRIYKDHTWMTESSSVSDWHSPAHIKLKMGH